MMDEGSLPPAAKGQLHHSEQCNRIWRRPIWALSECSRKWVFFPCPQRLSCFCRSICILQLICWCDKLSVSRGREEQNKTAPISPASAQPPFEWIPLPSLFSIFIQKGLVPINLEFCLWETSSFGTSLRTSPSPLGGQNSAKWWREGMSLRSQSWDKRL